MVTVPVVSVLGLLLLLAGGVAADADAASAADLGVLRAGAVPAEYEVLVQRAGQTCPGITAPLLAAQLEAESGWDPDAVSPAGARGLAQFMPGTWIGEGIDADQDGVRDPFGPADAIASQASFMCKLLAAVAADKSLIGDPTDLALAGYNSGLGAVQQHQGVPPYPETQRYIARIRTLLAKYTDAVITGAGRGSGWVRPIEGAPVTSGFGNRWGRLHAGIDFAAPIGTPIYAASSGTVAAAGPASGYGQWVKIQHPGDVTTVYGHLSRWTVAVGQAVHRGQLIAYTGNEGRSTGPHLHFEVRPQDRPVDPVAFYLERGTDLT
jgi:murein DD-endopeptidase MepM/ murein hydrolase activator NlpD